MKAGILDTAVEHFQKTLAIRRIQLGPVHRDTINCLAQLGHATAKQERWVTAQKLYQLARAQCQARPVSSVVHTSRGLRAHSCENAAYTEVIDG